LPEIEKTVKGDYADFLISPGKGIIREAHDQVGGASKPTEQRNSGLVVAICQIKFICCNPL